MHESDSANVAIAALVTQLQICMIAIIAAFIIWAAEQRVPQYRKRRGADARTFGWVILMLVLASIAPLILSNAIVALWSPVFVGVRVPVVDTERAISTMFVVNVVGLGILVYQTGGSRQSPFSPLLFILPALALFLRQSFGSVIRLSLLLFVAFTILLYKHRFLATKSSDDADEVRAVARADYLAYWTVVLLTLAMTTLVAFIADPRWTQAD